MKNWKNKLIPMLFALGSVSFFVAAVVAPVLKGEPINNTYLAFAIVFFVFGVVFFAVGRKSGGGSEPPSA